MTEANASKGAEHAEQCDVGDPLELLALLITSSTTTSPTTAVMLTTSVSSFSADCGNTSRPSELSSDGASKSKMINKHHDPTIKLAAGHQRGDGSRPSGNSSRTRPNNR